MHFLRKGLNEHLFELHVRVDTQTTSGNCQAKGLIVPVAGAFIVFILLL